MALLLLPLLDTEHLQWRFDEEQYSGSNSPASYSAECRNLDTRHYVRVHDRHEDGWKFLHWSCSHTEQPWAHHFEKEMLALENSLLFH